MQVDAPVAAVTQKLLKTWCILRGGDNENVTYTSQHQGTERIIDHRLVVNRQKWFRDNPGQRVEPSAGAASEDDTFSFRHDFFSSISVNIRTTLFVKTSFSPQHNQTCHLADWSKARGLSD